MDWLLPTSVIQQTTEWTHRRPVNPVGSADAKLLPAPILLGVASDRIGVTSVAVAFPFKQHKHTRHIVSENFQPVLPYKLDG